MEKILISACLVGEQVRYDAADNLIRDPRLQQWQWEGRLVEVCPEVSGGLPVPRPPAEIEHGDGHDVLKGKSRVLAIDGEDVTDAYRKGANLALQTARQFDINIAILKACSPSCGIRMIYDGTFSGVKKPGMGVTAALLESNGIKVFNESELDQAAEYLQILEAAS